MATTPEVIDDYTENDTLPTFDRTHTPDDITTWTITLRMRRTDGTILSKAATIVSGPAGTYSFTFVAGDLQAGGSQETEIELNDGVGGIQTVGNILFNVRTELG